MMRAASCRRPAPCDAAQNEKAALARSQSIAFEMLLSPDGLHLPGDVKLARLALSKAALTNQWINRLTPMKLIERRPRLIPTRVIISTLSVTPDRARSLEHAGFRCREEAAF